MSMYEAMREAIARMERRKKMTTDEIIQDAHRNGESAVSALYFAGRVTDKDIQDSRRDALISQASTEEIMDEFKKRILRDEDSVSTKTS